MSDSQRGTGVEILAPTFLEYWAVRCTLSRACVHWTGLRLARWRGTRQGSIVIVCGLAGALTPGLPAGTVLIPERVGLADGSSLHCDPALVQALVTAAHSLHLHVETGPLLTARSLIVGNERHRWFRRGFVAADMEAGLLAGCNLRVATVRVVLDHPGRDISSNWSRPGIALLQPSLWRELFWLSRVAPRYALRAARVLKIGLGTRPENVFIE